MRDTAKGSRAALVIGSLLLLGLVGALASCGGGGGPSPTQRATTSPGSRERACRRAWHCGAVLTRSDLSTTFHTWPQVGAVYRNGNSFTVYTTLGAASYSKGIKICDTVVEDLASGTVPLAGGNPYVLVVSGGGPAHSVELADGATIGTGCTSLGP